MRARALNDSCPLRGERVAAMRRRVRGLDHGVHEPINAYSRGCRTLAGSPTDTKSYDDLTALADLPQVELRATQDSIVHGEDGVTRFTIQNPTPHLAFFVHLKIINKYAIADEEYGFLPAEELPVLWQDNYFSLAPGEKREITATYRQSDFRGTSPAFEIDGWNVIRENF